MTESPLTALSRIESEAKRALHGLADGRIPKGSSALVNIKNLASDALHEAHKNGRIDYEEVETP